MVCRKQIEPLKVAQPLCGIGVDPPECEPSSGVTLNVKGEQLPMWHLSG